MVQLVETMS